MWSRLDGGHWGQWICFIFKKENTWCLECRKPFLSDYLPMVLIAFNFQDRLLRVYDPGFITLINPKHACSGRAAIHLCLNWKWDDLLKEGFFSKYIDTCLIQNCLFYDFYSLESGILDSSQNRHHTVYALNSWMLLRSIYSYWQIILISCNALLTAFKYLISF